jgi:glycosyltransferase involved in cell wall biosynthesis
MNLPTIAICLITYNRPIEARQTIAALRENLYYSGQLKFYIADDYSPKPYGDDLRAWVQTVYPGNYVKLCRTSQNVGWGANANNALYQISEPIVLQIEDDYTLQRPINITPYVLLLLEDVSVGLVRLDGIAGHRVTAHAMEFEVGKWLPDYKAGFGGASPRLHYWRLDARSLETWVYSHRPHLKHRRFHEAFGIYPEGLTLGATEESFAHVVKDAMLAGDAPGIAVPFELSLGNFEHIGVSYQHTEHDRSYK